MLAPLAGNIIAWCADTAEAEPWERQSDKQLGYSANSMEIRVAAWRVLQELPGYAATVDGGRRVPRVMAKLGWRKVRFAEGVWYKRPR